MAPSLTKTVNYSGSPADILAAAAVMSKDSARQFVFESLNQCGLWNWSLLYDICMKPEFDDWIEDFIRAGTYLQEFTFDQWWTLARALHMMRGVGWDDKDADQFELMRWAEKNWSSAMDQRRVRFFLLGRFWSRNENIRLVYDDLVECFNSFICQPEVERDILRRLWHKKEEQAVYDELPAQITVHRGGLSPTMWLGFSYTFELEMAAMAANGHDHPFDCEFMAPGHPRIISRRVPKSEIVGVKFDSEYYGDGVLDVVALPCLAGQSLGGV